MTAQALTFFSLALIYRRSRRHREFVARVLNRRTGACARSGCHRASISTSTVKRLRISAAVHIRGAAGRYPRDESLQSLVGDLLEQSGEFARLWREARVEPHRSQTKRLMTRLGPITLDCDVLSMDGDLRVVVYTAVRGSAADEALQALQRLPLEALPRGEAAMGARRKSSA